MKKFIDAMFNLRAALITAGATESEADTKMESLSAEIGRCSQEALSGIYGPLINCIGMENRLAHSSPTWCTSST